MNRGESFPGRSAAAVALQGALLCTLPCRSAAQDPVTGIVSGAEPLYVIYVPYATPESIGLSTVPVGGQPWLMFPGLPWAHIMIMK